MSSEKPMPSDDLQLSALLCARLCHDLVGPVSAISNGVEFLGDEDAAMRAQAAELIGQSAGQVGRRLQFFRYAFGRLDGGQIPLQDVARTASEFFADRKIALTWPPLEGVEPDAPLRAGLKLVLNMTLFLSEALIRGGEIGIGAEDGAVSVVARGPFVELDPALRAAFESGLAAAPADLAAIGPRAIQPFLTARLGKNLGARLEWGHGSDPALVLNARLR